MGKTRHPPTRGERGLNFSKTKTKNGSSDSSSGAKKRSNLKTMTSSPSANIAYNNHFVSPLGPGGSGPSGNSMTMTSPTTSSGQGTFSVPLNLSTSGKVIKRKGKDKTKKNVTFRQNLTDVLAAGQVLETSEKIKLKLGKKNQKFGHADNSSTMVTATAAKSFFNNCSELTGKMKKILKTVIPDKKSRHKIKKESFQKKIEILKKSEKEKQAAKKRKETIIVGDMQPMLQALETEVKNVTSISGTSGGTSLDHPLGSLQSFVSGHNLEEFKSIPKKSKINMKKREKEIQQGLEYFAQGLSGHSSSKFPF